MAAVEDQQFCLRWNNFQANITSQFETLRDDEDFTDVTIACDGQRLQAHKVVLSACSPFFKDLFKNNPCQHPIIFMRDVEARHIVALMEFMYAGEVNVAQAHLSGFLKTAESLRIRGLTDTAPTTENYKEHEDTLFLNSQLSSSKQNNSTALKQKSPNSKSQISSSSTVTSSQDISVNSPQAANSPPPSKRLCKSDRTDPDIQRLRQLNVIKEDSISVNPFLLDGRNSEDGLQPKVELPDYLSDDDRDEPPNFFHNADGGDITGGMEIIPQASNHSMKDINHDSSGGSDSRKLHSLDPRPCEECGRVYSNLSNLRQHMKLIHYPTYVECPICNKSFKTDLYLRRHTLSCHDTHLRPPLIIESTKKFQSSSSSSRNDGAILHSYSSTSGMKKGQVMGRNFGNSKHMANCVPLKYQLRSGSNI